MYICIFRDRRIPRINNKFIKVMKSIVKNGIKGIIYQETLSQLEYGQ